MDGEVACGDSTKGEKALPTAEKIVELVEERIHSFL